MKVKWTWKKNTPTLETRLASHNLYTIPGTNMETETLSMEHGKREGEKETNKKTLQTK